MADEPVPAIFLSHSGRQKAFVEHLYNALQSANHTAFFDKHTLPRGSPFPPHIKRAACGCKVGVVVLSNNFLTSKWPMMELKMLVLRPRAIVIPLFYKISPQDLKSAKNLYKWRRVWKRVTADQEAEEWEQAVKVLRSFNGEVLTPGTSEAAYIKRVVHVLCSLVKSPILHDISWVQGHQRFAQEVASQFEEAARQCDNVCMVGLYGVGGLGKTTMCKVMCNFYASQYSGKSHSIEFPTDGDHKKVVEECKKTLKKLADLSDEYVLHKADSFDQVVQLMKENLGRHDVFLAIDNVSEGCAEAATRMLQVSFSTKSKILLTSRSKEVLKDLVRGHSNTLVRPLPSLVHELAFELFQHTFQLADLPSWTTSLVNSNLLDSVLKTCCFSGNYHALALKAVALHVKRVCALDGLDKLECCLSDILQGVRNDHTILQQVNDRIKLNYVNLAPEKQHVFLDIVVVVMVPETMSMFTYEDAHRWLSILYKKKHSNSTITKLISELALDGLIQLENVHDTSSEQMMSVHDLYSDLAHREAAGSPRFFTDWSTRSLKEIQWERLERVILRDPRHDNQCFIQELQQQECQNLQVLSAGNIDWRSRMQLDLMPSLCVLKLGCQHLKELVPAEASVFEVWEACYINLEGLEIEQFNSVNTVLNLNGLVNLQWLRIIRCDSVERIEGLDALKNLKSLHVLECLCLRNLDGLTSAALKHVMVCGCEALKRMPDLSGLTGLEKLVLYNNKSMDEVVGGLTSPALKLVDVRGCKVLKRMPDLSGLTGLEKLLLYGNKSMEEVVGGLTSPALKVVEVRRCEALKRMPDLSGLTGLEKLLLFDIKSMEEVVGGLTSPALKVVEVRRCEGLKRMPDLSGLTGLERLLLVGNKSMEEVVGGLTSPALKVVVVHGCEALKRMPDLSGLSGLEKLVLWDNKSMEEVVGDLTSPALKMVMVRGSEALKTMPDLSGLTGLKKLVLCDNKSMEESHFAHYTAYIAPGYNCSRL